MAAIKLVARSVGSGRIIGLGDLFRHPTPRALNAFVQARRAEAQRPAATPGEPARLSPAGRHWLARRDELTQGTILTCILEMDGPTQPGTVEQALRAIVQRHDGLRLRVGEHPDGWRVSFAEAPDFACRLADSTATAESSAKDSIDPTIGRLIGAALVEPQRRELVLAIHHLGFDWHSLPHLIAILRAEIDGSRRVAQPAPFSHIASAGERKMGLVKRAAQPVGAHRVITRTLALSPGAREEAEERLSARLLELLAARHDGPTCIAIEQSVRNEESGDVIGWLAGFRFRTHTPQGYLTRTDVTDHPPDDDLAAEAVINVIPGEAGIEGLRILNDVMVPAHPIAIELDISVESQLSVFADADWDEAEHADLADELAAAISDENMIVPLQATALQRIMIAGAIAYPEAALYHSQIPLEIEGEWDTDALVGAWDDAMSLHDCLRLRYTIDAEGLPAISLHPLDSLAGAHVERTDRPVNAAFADLLSSDLNRPFPAGAPLSRVALLIAPDGARVLWSHHHCIADGWSLNLILETVAQRYAARVGTSPTDNGVPPPRITPYLRWWQGNEARTSSAGLAERIHLYGPSMARPERYRPQGGQASTRLLLDRSVSSRLRRLASQHDLSLFEVFVAAWALVQSRRTGREAVGFQVVATVRPAAVPSVERLAGLCMNVLPCVLPVPRKLLDLLASVRSAIAAIHDAQTTSPRTLADLLRTVTGSGELETQLVFENYPGDRHGQPLGKSGRLTTLESRERSFTRFTLIIVPDEDIQLELLYSRNAKEASEALSQKEQLGMMLNHLASIAEPTSHA